MSFDHTPFITVAGNIVGSNPVYSQDQKTGGQLCDFTLRCPNDKDDDPSDFQVRARANVASNMHEFEVGKDDWVRVTGKLKLRYIKGVLVAQIAAVDVADSFYYRGD